MSDTPRTDNEFVKAFEDSDYPTTHMTEWAMKLEREADKLAKQCVRNVEEIGQLRAALENAKKDAARVDWLDNHVGLYDVAEYFGRDLLTHDQMCNLRLREGIDAAMEAQNDDV